MMLRSIIRQRHSVNSDISRAIKRIFGFSPRNIGLYRQALLHSSSSERNALGQRLNNERLEYLGDSVLSAVVAAYLFKRYPGKSEGFLTEMRSKIVSRVSLNKVGQQMHLNDLIKTANTSRDRFRFITGDAVEALFGAIFLDKGYRFTEKIIIKHLLSHYIDINEVENREWNFKGKLIGWGQSNKKTVSFRTLKIIQQEGNKRLYKVEVSIDNKHTFTAENYSIKSAEQLAAERAYKDFVNSEHK